MAGYPVQHSKVVICAPAGSRAGKRSNASCTPTAPWPTMHCRSQLAPLPPMPTHAHALFAVLQVPLQQAEPSLHASPAHRQAQRPPVQLAEQHSELRWHA